MKSGGTRCPQFIDNRLLLASPARGTVDDPNASPGVATTVRPFFSR